MLLEGYHAPAFSSPIALSSPTDSPEVELVLTDGCVLEGTVRDGEGNPVPNAFVDAEARFAGGVSEGRLTRPAGVPALLITDGVSHLQFDDRERQSSGAELRVRSRAYDRAPDRYEVEIGGGISDLVIDEE